MTNLTSEQFRDVIKHVHNATEEIPNIQQLLRRAVQSFYKRFGAYPELAGVAPGNVGILGDQLQFNMGIVMPVATQMATIVVGRKVPGKRFTVATSSDVGKPNKVSFSFSPKRPLAPGCPKWLNYIKAVIDAFGEGVPPFEAVFESTFPKGDCFGTIPSLEVALYTFLEILVGRRTNPIVKAKALQAVEDKFGNKKFGLVERITSILAKDRQIMVIDCKTNEVLWLPFGKKDLDLILVYPHLNYGDYDSFNEYNEVEKYLAKACEILGIASLRHYEEDYTVIESKFNEVLRKAQEREEKEAAAEEEEEEEEKGETISDEWTAKEYLKMIKKAKFYLLELRRIDAAIKAWIEGKVDLFANVINESQQSLKEDFGYDNPVCNFLVDTSMKMEGVLASRVTGPGLGYGILTFIKKDKIEEYCKQIKEKYSRFVDQIAEELREKLQHEKQKEYELRKALLAKNDKSLILQRQTMEGDLESAAGDGGKAEKGQKEKCSEDRTVPCVMKTEKKSRCGTWAHFQEEPKKEKSLQKKSVKEEKFEENSEGRSESLGEASSEVSQIPKPELQELTFYRISPFTGARMMFVTKSDLLRSFYAAPSPHPKALAKDAVKHFEETYRGKIEVITLTPASVGLFGDFMEFHLGNIILMTVPLYVVVVGGRNDSVFFSLKTTLETLQDQPVMHQPIPCVRPLEMESRLWANHVSSLVSDFRNVVPGFNALIHSSVPPSCSLHSRTAMHTSVFTFLENFTGDITECPYEKVNRCHRCELDMDPNSLELIENCTSIKYFSVFFSKEGHLTAIDCKRSEISNYYFDDPSYVFILVCCRKNTSGVTLETLEERLRACRNAIDLLGKRTLLNLDLKHLKCLKKKGASEEMIRRAKYVITEHQRTLDAIKAIQAEDYKRVGLLMTQSHVSLRDDFGVSSPEIEELFELALSVEGVLGAKLVGKGLTTTLVILINISNAETCIRYMKKNYTDKTDKPFFYITKPAGGVFSMDPNVDLPYII